MSKLKTSFLKTLFVTISALFIFGCTVNVSVQESNNDSKVPETLGELEILSESSFLIPGQEVILSAKSSDGKALSKITWTNSNSKVVEVLKQSDNSKYKIKGLEKGTSLIKAVESGTNRTAEFKIEVKDAYINVTDTNDNIVQNINLGYGKDITLNYNVVSGSLEKSNDKVTFTVSSDNSSNYQNYFDITQNKGKNTITIRAKKTDFQSIPTFTLKLSAKLSDNFTASSQDIKFTSEPKAGKPAEPKPQEPEYSSEYGIQITLSSQGSGNIAYDGKSLYIGQKYDVRGLAYENPSSLEDFTVHLNNKIYTGNNIDTFFEKEDKVFSGIHYYLLVLKDTLKSGDVIKFSGTVFGNKVITNELTIKAKSSSGGGSITPTPTPNPGTNPGGGSKPEFEIGKPQIIKHDYDKEVVRWFGGITPPKPSDFVDYESVGQKEPILNENGEQIGEIESNIKVPRYYVTDTSKMGAGGSTLTPEFGDSTWYNVTKSFSQDAPDSAMCWAMASAGALHWWFDYLGEDYTKKLFEIRQNRTDLKGKNSSSEFLFNSLKANDIHYEPLPNQIDDVNKIAGRSGIGSYAVKSFRNLGGNPIDLFRLYFLDENTNRFEANYNKGPKSLGLLHGMGYPFSGRNSDDDLLFEPVGLSNMRKDDIIRQFKTALDQKAAVVLHQANLPDEVLGDNGIGARAHHAIIVWGVIFADETEQEIVGLYIGDNNLKEGNLARVDLAFKQLSNAGGRYYYASPFVSQDSDNYMKQTSIYQITKLFPPKESTKQWIDKKHAEVMAGK